MAAIIRIDSIKGFGVGPQSKEDIKKVLGPIAMPFGPRKDWDNCTLPCGSEGSLVYNIWENDDDSDIPAFTVSVFGDLRDYEETDSIQTWFNQLCDSFPIIRQAIYLAETEGCNPQVFRYDKEEDDEDYGKIH